ncbi:MAG: hypothetical protein ACW99A_11375 [Candidatus Kariarchaeaceae archaeon]|jgi:hypothetical protein
MFVANDLRMLLKGFCILSFILGIFFPLIVIEFDAESTDNMVESFEEDFVVVYSNRVLEGNIDDSEDDVKYNKPSNNNLLNLTMQFLLIIAIIIMSLSLIADFLEKEEGFIGEWYSAFTAFILFLIVYLIITLKVYFLESDFTDVGGRSIYEEIQTSRGTVSFFVSTNESFWFRLIQISLLSMVILPISNKLLKEKIFETSPKKR